MLHMSSSFRLNNTIFIFQTRFNFPRVSFYFILLSTTWCCQILSFFVLPEGYDPLALVDGFTPVEDNIGLLETMFDVEAVLVIVYPDDVTGSVNLTLLSLFFGVTATNFPSVLLTL
ncbi:hypothetical protein Tco_0075675, partial [Tanacetum coccineum]